MALGVCGGIAAYKAVEVARQLTLAGADVHVVMTPSATEFVGPITFSTLTGNPVRTELFPADAPTKIPHTDLGRTADVVVVAPATADLMSRYARGASNDLMSALLLSARGPIVMAPAMHTEMWEDPATRENLKILQSRGVRFVGPVKGALAGPDAGIGRLAEPPEIIAAIARELSVSSSLDGATLLITAGGTQEPIDPVRYIGNRSSGLMGIELAFEALRRGAKVILVSGPTSLPLPDSAEVVKVTTAAEMHEAVTARAAEARAIVMAAAVADWRPSATFEAKLKKSSGPPSIDLAPTVDILAELGRSSAREGHILVGFCAETEEVVAHAQKKLMEKNVDLMVGNWVGVADSGFEVPTNRAVIVRREGEVVELPLMSKRELAGIILDEVASLL